LEKYGVENPSQLTEIKEKKKQAYLNRYRVDNPLKDLKIREKRKRTCQRKYGTDHPLKNSEIKEKQRQTRLSKGYNWTEQRAQQFVQSFGYHLVKWGKGVHHKSIFRCPKEHIYTAKFNDFQQGNRCPACSESKGEKIVAEILTNQGVKFIREYRLQKDKKSLRLDFFIPSLNFGIEYDGEQHFRPVIGAFGNKTKEQAKATFKRQQQNDIKKNKICKDLGIKLIRIKYNENAKQMLESHLNEKGLTLDNRRLYNGTNWDCTRKF
jgi:very-short-patch-repair endonuclease